MVKQIVVFTYHGTLSSNKKEQTMAIYNSFNGSQGNCTKFKIKTWYILHDYIIARGQGEGRKEGD